MKAGIFLFWFIVAFACAAVPPLLIPVGILALAMIARKRR